MWTARKFEKSRTNKLEKISLDAPENLRKSSVSQSSPVKRGNSVRQDISELLKLSANMRKKSLFKADKRTEAQIPEIEVKICDESLSESLGEELSKDDFFTFGLQ